MLAFLCEIHSRCIEHDAQCPLLLSVWTTCRRSFLDLFCCCSAHRELRKKSCGWVDAFPQQGVLKWSLKLFFFFFFSGSCFYEVLCFYVSQLFPSYNFTHSIPIHKGFGYRRIWQSINSHALQNINQLCMYVYVY